MNHRVFLYSGIVSLFLMCLVAALVPSWRMLVTFLGVVALGDMVVYTWLDYKHNR